MELLLTYLRDRFSRQWKTVSKEEAQRNQYYGFKGWLLLFYLYWLFALVSGVMDFVRPVPEVVLVIYDSPTAYRAISVLGLILQIPALVLAPLKHPLFPRVAIWTNLILLLLALLIMSKTSMNSLIVFLIIIAFLMTILSTWYLLSSKRVNVTYHHRVPPNSRPRPFYYKRAMQKPPFKD